MNILELAGKIESAAKGIPYTGSMTKYCVESILTGRGSYPFANLMDYCNAVGLQVAVTDMNTDESYDVESEKDIHAVIGMMMERYHIKEQDLQKKSSTSYSVRRNPKSSISIRILLNVLSSLHGRLDFIKK